MLKKIERNVKKYLSEILNIDDIGAKKKPIKASSKNLKVVLFDTNTAYLYKISKAFEGLQNTIL